MAFSPKQKAAFMLRMKGKGKGKGFEKENGKADDKEDDAEEKGKGNWFDKFKK